MPLIIITGYPSSGKSRRAEELKNGLEDRIKDANKNNNNNNNSKGSIPTAVHVINDEQLNLSKTDYYDSKSEKIVRGEQMSAVKKLLSKSDIVILDGLNYIKGFRYQLFCEAKAVETNCCVIHVGAPSTIAKEWNSKREPESSRWPQDLFDALIFRYEEPNSATRWDSPLFTVMYNDNTLPMDDIWAVTVLNLPKPANKATLVKPANQSNYLSQLERQTQSIVSQLLDSQKINPGGLIKLGLDDDKYNFQLPPNPILIGPLQRIRRNFINLNKVRALDSKRIPALFVEFLDKNLV